MDLAVAAVALVVAVVSLSAAINFGRTQRTLSTDIAALRTQLDQVQRDRAADIETLHAELQQSRRELGELKAALEAVPAPPPLPRARSGGLDDLRQQLRAAHAESDESAE
jgi:hypothetical protein